MEEPGRLQFMGSLRVGHDWASSLSCIGEGNGNPLQCSCLENPRDKGAAWADIYGVTQSRTRLKRLSSSSRDAARQLTSTAHFISFAWICRPPGGALYFQVDHKPLNTLCLNTGHILRRMFLVTPLQAFESVSFYTPTPLAFILIYYWRIKDLQVVLVKNPHANAGDTWDMGLIPGSGRSPGGGHGNPLQYLCLENSMDRGAWWAIVHGASKSWSTLLRIEGQIIEPFSLWQTEISLLKHLPCPPAHDSRYMVLCCPLRASAHLTRWPWFTAIENH